MVRPRYEQERKGVGVDWKVIDNLDAWGDPRLKMYRAFSRQMQSGDMVEWYSRSPIGWAIRMFTGADVNHTSAIIRMDYAQLENRRFMVEALAKGLQLRLISERLMGHRGKVYWYKLRDELVPEGRAKVASWLLREVGLAKGYDYPNLVANALGAVSLDGRRWFCSECYHAALVNVGYVKAPADGKALRPGGFTALGVHHPRVLIYDSKEVQRHG